MTYPAPQVIVEAEQKYRELWVRTQLWEYSPAAEVDTEIYEQEGAELQALEAEMEAAKDELDRLYKLWDEGKLE